MARSVDTNFVMGEPNVLRRNIEISAITLSFASVVSLAILVWACCNSTQKGDKAVDIGESAGNYTSRTKFVPIEEDAEKKASQFLLRL